MKRTLALALCALLAIHAAEARTLYVNAKRPNNKGNGLSVKKAKKTIQAAINIAKNGDTILVYPGYYSPIKTKNKKITIKSVKGDSVTTIRPGDWTEETTVLNLGNGTATKVVGFTVTPGWDRLDASYGWSAGVKGGTVQKCWFISVGLLAEPSFYKSVLKVCTLQDCYPSLKSGVLAKSCTLNRCTISDTHGSVCAKMLSCKIFNSLVAENESSVRLSDCVLVNDTFANNPDFRIKKTKAYNTIFFDVAASQFVAAKGNKFSKCCKSATPGFVAPTIVDVPYDNEDGQGFTEIPADYHLTADSRCIDKGKLTAAQKKLIGSKDFDGKSRINGKTVDVGCYEY